jgi:ribosomal protein S8
MDFLSKRINYIRNGQKASRRQVVICLSNSATVVSTREHGFKLLVSALEILRREGYIRAFKFSIVKQFVKSKNKKSQQNTEKNSLKLIIYLKYDSVGTSAIRSIFRAGTSARGASIQARSF